MTSTSRPKSEFAHLIPSLAVAALDRATDAIAIFTAHESPLGAQIVYVNEAHERLSGYYADQLLGHSSVLLAGARPDLEHVREIEAVREVPFVTETRKYRPDGTAYVVELHLTPIPGPDGAATHMVLTQRESEQERERSRGDARRRFEAALATRDAVSVGRLAAGAAYELEGPLSAISVTLRAALASRFADEELELLADLNEAARATEWLEETVRGLRAFGAVEDAPHGVDVHEAIELAAHFTKGEISARATLHRQYGATHRAHGSTARLTRVLTSLLRNAAESIPRSTPWANSVTLQTGVTPDGLVSIEVTDTGVGIEPDDLPYVFDPFFTTKPSPASPGLGLAAARADVLEMGGTIAIQSTVGRGTRVRILLPAAESAGSPLLHFFEAEEPRGRRVLCVAESAVVERRLRDLVEDGETHLLFATCSDALERLASGEDYDLILCDAAASVRHDFREQLTRLAPHALTRTFALALRPNVSGMFGIVDATRRAAGGE
jgi:PAS domain S-box-containing protein